MTIMKNNHQHSAFPNPGEDNQRPHQSRQRERESAEARRRQGQAEAELRGATAATPAATTSHDRAETTDPGCIAILSAALGHGRSVDPRLTIPDTQKNGLGQVPSADSGKNLPTIGPTRKDTKGGEARAHANETSPTSASAAPHMGVSRSTETPVGSKAQPHSTTTITSKNGTQSVEGKIKLHGTKVKNGSIIDTGEYYMIPKEFCSIIQTGTGTLATNASSGQEFSIDPRWTNSPKRNNGPET